MNKYGLKLMSAHSFVLFFSNRTAHDAHWADAGRSIALVGNDPAVFVDQLQRCQAIGFV